MLSPVRLALLAIAAAVLASCAPSASRSQPPDAAAASQCAERGGTYQQVGMFGTWSCVVTYASGGRSCTDGTQCTGACVFEGDPLPREGDAVEGICQRTSAQFGCYAEIENGVARQPICVD